MSDGHDHTCAGNNPESGGAQNGPTEVRANSPRSLMLLFWGTSLAFLALIVMFVIAQSGAAETRRIFEVGVVPAALLMAILGIMLTIKAWRAKVRPWFRRALIATGVSAAGIPLSALLHNVVYVLAIALFGPDVWGAGGQHGGDEPFFFILAIIFLPVLLVAGSLTGTAIYLLRRGDIATRA